MKKTQVALAALALVASTAVLADGVAIYGNADASAISGGGKTSFDGGGGYTTSLIGFRGSEDLGNGLKASFNLETAVNLGDGGRGGGSGGNTGLFNRAANLSLGTESLTVTLGNILSIAVAGAFTGATAGAGDNLNVPAVVRLMPAPGVVSHSGGPSGFFIPDALTISGGAGGLTVKAQTRVGKNAETETGYNAVTVGGAIDVINFSIGHQQSTGGAAGDYKTMYAAANIKIGDIGLNGAYAKNTGTVSANTYMFGASYPLTEAASIGAIYARGVAGDNQTSVNLKYSLSKSTVAYTTVSSFGNGAFGTQYSNTNNGEIGLNAKNVIAVGISHSF